MLVCMMLRKIGIPFYNWILKLSLIHYSPFFGLTKIIKLVGLKDRPTNLIIFAGTKNVE